MLFLWTTTKLGKIWVDGDAIKLIISKRLPQELYVQEISFIGEKNLDVYKRQDGTLFSNIEIPSNLHLPLIARIKILSGMDIAEKRRPQDGRILILSLIHI